MSELAIIIKIVVSVITLITIWVIVENNERKYTNYVNVLQNYYKSKYDKKEISNKSDTNKIYHLTNDLAICTCNNIDLRLKNIRLEDEIEKRDKRIRELENIIENN